MAMAWPTFEVSLTFFRLSLLHIVTQSVLCERFDDDFIDAHTHICARGSKHLLCKASMRNDLSGNRMCMNLPRKTPIAA